MGKKERAAAVPETC